MNITIDTALKLIICVLLSLALITAHWWGWV